MDAQFNGRYRHAGTPRGSRWRRRLLLSAIVIMASTVASVYVTGFRPGTDVQGSHLALGDDGYLSDDRSDEASRDSDRTGGDRRRSPVPTAKASLPGPKVNGRHQPPSVDPPKAATGDYDAVPGQAAAPERSADETVKYLVEVEQGLPFDHEAFADDVHTILNDERGWGNDGSVKFERVDEGPVQFRVSLSSADLTDQECLPLLTRGKVSCWNGTRAVINAERWGKGSDTYDDDILSYREYLISHEVGHALGHAHVDCPGDGEPAPTMVQQTKTLEGCSPNPWPSL